MEVKMKKILVVFMALILMVPSNIMVDAIPLEGSLTLEKTEPAVLYDGNIDGGRITLELTNDTFLDESIDITNISFHSAVSNLDENLQVASATISEANLIITLSYTGEELSETVTDLSITLDKSELIGGSDITVNNLIVKN